MPCQCATTPSGGPEAETISSGCGCASESNAGCGCDSTPEPSDRASSLERVVMDLDQRLRKLEAGR